MSRTKFANPERFRIYLSLPSWVEGELERLYRVTGMESPQFARFVFLKYFRSELEKMLLLDDPAKGEILGNDVKPKRGRKKLPIDK